jgi:P-type Cu+ transporter
MSTESKYNMASARLTVPGMGSDHCAGIVKTSLKRLNGIGEITTNIAAPVSPVPVLQA